MEEENDCLSIDCVSSDGSGSNLHHWRLKRAVCLDGLSANPKGAEKKVGFFGSFPQRLKQLLIVWSPRHD
jgi:hypothetical protein